jgi:hypothetical protein
MKYIRLILLQIIVLVFSCTSQKNKDLSEVNALIEITDSLLNKVQNQFDFSTKNFYKLIDDSTYVDSIFQTKGLSVPSDFYRNLELKRIEYEEVYIQTKKEVLFVQHQLESLKMEFSEEEILQSDYLMELSEFKELVYFLQERVDSNILIISKKPSSNLLLNDDLE